MAVSAVGALHLAKTCGRARVPPSHDRRPTHSAAFRKNWFSVASGRLTSVDLSVSRLFLRASASAFSMIDREARALARRRLRAIQSTLANGARPPALNPCRSQLSLVHPVFSRLPVLHLLCYSHCRSVMMCMNTARLSPSRHSLTCLSCRVVAAVLCAQEPRRRTRERRSWRRLTWLWT